ncbi:MAG: hypothetical protein PHS54_07480 [Clostridia bacterium]|nr:hypothetical protein [Clostridia bacterium]
MLNELENLTIKLCEKLPLDITLYEINGFCTKPNENCDYCEKSKDELYLCNKKTYVFEKELKFCLNKLRKINET